MNVEPFNARERWIAAAALLLILLLLGSLRSSGQELSSFTETNAFRAADKFPLVTGASGSNVNVWATGSNITLQVLGGLRPGTGFAFTTNASNQTVTLTGSPDAGLSNALVTQINTASNANSSRTTVASNALQTWITLNSNNVDSVSNAFRTSDATISNLVNTGDTAISNRLTTITTGLTALTNNKLNATSGVHSGTLVLTNTARLSIYGGLGGTNLAEIKVDELGDPAPYADGTLLLNNRLGIAVEASTNGWLRAYQLESRTTNSIHLSAANTNTSATAGGNTLPANPLGFVLVQINGRWVKMPYYLP